MLYTDRVNITQADLESIDPEVTRLAASLQIKITGPGGVLERAWIEFGNALLSALQSFNTIATPNGISADHTAAVLNTGLGGAAYSRPQLQLHQIVTDNGGLFSGRMHSPLQLCALYHALVILYEQAYQRKTEDRFAKKLEVFQARYRDQCWPELRRQGVPFVYVPLPCPGASFFPQSGLWSVDASASLIDGAGSEGLYEISVTWVSPAYQGKASRHNAESAPSTRLAIQAAADKLLRVNISTLNPPAGSHQIGVNSFSTMAASGWNVYAGLAGQPLYLINAAPIPVATKVYDFLAAPTANPYLDALALEYSGQFAHGQLAVTRTVNRA